jgi:hypothetical protein
VASGRTGDVAGWNASGRHGSAPARRPGGLPEPFEAVQHQVEGELELVVAALADDRRVVVGDGGDQLGDVGIGPANWRSMAACVSGSAGAVSSNSSWEKPSRRLPMACIAWWVRSIEKPPARNSPIIESM